MSTEKVRNYLKEWNLDHRVREFESSSATVLLAAQALKCEPERIAKTLAFMVDGDPILVVVAGDARIDNKKFKLCFSSKPKMLSHEQTESFVGHKVGGVCPFAVNENIRIFLDKSLKRFESVFPACGSSNSAIELSILELENTSNYIEWIDVAKDWS
ncbi:YbaK/EbsC family protein [Eubacteriaceae bacterium ES3]|nr:YbaK/EbsC family protein [Eubacteriaceae bacterium ES3]